MTAEARWETILDDVSVAPTIAAFMFDWHYELPIEHHQHLVALLDQATGTGMEVPDGYPAAAPEADEIARAWLCIDWVVRTLTPALVGTMPEMRAHSYGLASLGRIDGADRMHAAARVLHDTRDAFGPLGVFPNPITPDDAEVAMLAGDAALAALLPNPEGLGPVEALWVHVTNFSAEPLWQDCVLAAGVARWALLTACYRAGLAAVPEPNPNGHDLRTSAARRVLADLDARMRPTVFELVRDMCSIGREDP